MGEDSGTQRPARRPNIVLILADDHACHAVSAYGSAVNATPRIDEIARSGVKLENCFVTNALCSPSRASILTGTYSHINGVKTLLTPIDASQPTFVSLLQDAGYRTAVVGKWHLGEGPGHDPQGFDYWDVLLEQGEYYNPTFLSAGGSRQLDGYATDIITRLSIDWVESLDGDDPWCLLVFHKAPHRPWDPDLKHAGMYCDRIPVPDTFDDDLDTRTSSARRATVRIAEHMTSRDLKREPPPKLSYKEESLWKYQRYMEDYLRCVASVDDNVGHVIDWLRERGEFEDTLLIYSSDQGFFLGDHGWFDKRFMYEQSIRIPFLLSYPNVVEAGKVHSGIVTNVDFAQSILEAAGVADHPRMQGRSFWPCLTDQTEAPLAEGMYYRYWEHDDRVHKAPAHYGYRTHRYKIIYYYNDGMETPGAGSATYAGDWELYDLALDPDELRNVYDDPAYAAVRDELVVLMWREQKRLGDVPHPSQPRPVGLAQADSM